MTNPSDNHPALRTETVCWNHSLRYLLTMAAPWSEAKHFSAVNYFALPAQYLSETHIPPPEKMSLPLCLPSPQTLLIRLLHPVMLSVLPVMLSVLPVHCLPTDFCRPAHNRMRTTPSIPGSVRLSSCRYTSLSDN